MSTSIHIKAYSGKNSNEFLKHFNAVKFCLESDLSFPKETSEFFKGKVNGSDLETFTRDSLLKYIEDGIEIPLKISGDGIYEEMRIKVSDIPSEAEEIIIWLA